MEYMREARLFLVRSKEEVRRLENQIGRLDEIIARLEVVLGAEMDCEPILERVREESPRTAPKSGPEPVSPASFFPPPPPVPPSPVSPPEVLLRKTQDLRPVGEIAEEILKERETSVSLEDLYQAMKDRPDLSPSLDLKNAIRVSLIRRKPRIVSERRGWFRYVRES